MEPNVIMTVCMILGIASWGVTAFFAIRHRKNLKSIIRFAGVGVFVSLFIFNYPYAVVESGFFAVPFSLFQTMASAVIASDPMEIFEVLSTSYDVAYLGFYQAVVLILHVISPLFTIGITLSFFESRFAALLYRLRALTRASHIFSAVNERTLSLAESIYANGGKCVFVFLGDAEQLEDAGDFFERIRAVGGYILDTTAAEVRHSLGRTRTYYLLDFDSGKNLKDAIALFEKYDKVGGEKIKIWLYSKDEMSSIIFDNLDERIDIRLVNEEQLIAMGLMQKYPLYRGVKDGKLVFLLLGAGHIGLEILRNALWCSRFGADVTTEFHVLDLYADKAAQKLEKLCPGVAEAYHISFHNANVDSAEYTRLLRSIRPTYVVATLGEEQRNISACVEMRRIYGFDGDFPLIHVLIDHEDTATMVLENLRISDWSFSRETDHFCRRELCSFALVPFGSYAETYSSVRFSMSYYDSLAMAINAVRCGITELDERHDPEYLRDLLNKVEFYKDTTYAYATDIPYKLWMMGLHFVEDDAGDISLLEQTLPHYEERLLQQEGDRWVAFMRSRRWQPMPPEEVQDDAYQDKLRRTHARLDAEHLPALGARFGRDFDRENRDDLYRLPTIIRLANSMAMPRYSIRAIEDDR